MTSPAAQKAEKQLKEAVDIVGRHAYGTETPYAVVLAAVLQAIATNELAQAIRNL